MGQVVRLLLRMLLRLLIVATVSCWGVSQIVGIGWVQVAGNRSAMAMAGPSGYSVEFFATTVATRTGFVFPKRAMIAPWADFAPAARVKHIAILGFHIWSAKNRDLKLAISYPTSLVLFVILALLVRRKR